MDVLPDLIAAARARGDGVLQCWSAGCASGEEPYTLAIVHRYGLAEEDCTMPIRIVATDAEPAVLERARRACYARGTLRELPAPWIEAAFGVEDAELCVRDQLRAAVELRCEDLRASMPDGPFDLVLCRNLVLTYFAVPLQREILTRIAARMVPGAALVVGTHEPLPDGIEALFEPWPGASTAAPRRGPEPRLVTVRRARTSHSGAPRHRGADTSLDCAITSRPAVAGTPATNERFCGSPHGNAYGAVRTPENALHRLPMQTPIRNLWLCNATSGWPGVAGTIASGIRLQRALTAEGL